ECKEAEVMRTAIDRLPDPDASVTDRLRAAGVLIEPQRTMTCPPLSEIDEVDDDEVTAGIGRIYLGEAVIEDRR
ncbi:MAG TPA: hypothetical protein VND24_09370, partial [Steroidobacteraceae bacterium]|nr:hypothetical protein [Steroidobacteraceae bacterium]